MQFTSLSFLLFAACVLVAYYLPPKNRRWVILLLASLFFYLQAGPWYILFLLLTAVSTYLCTRAMGSALEKQDAYLKEHKQSLSREEKKQYKAAVKAKNRRCLTLCLVLNFSVLALCKAALLAPVAEALKSGNLGFLTLGLPLGISFYMFQSMGYAIDVCRGSVPYEKSFPKLLLFVGYFPQLIQGPISKFSQLSPQLYAGHDFDGKQVSFGLQRLLWGYFKKLVIADRIAGAVIALRGEEFLGAGFFLLTVFYAVQIYADFTGGIDMALGLSQALGIQLEENFIRPFFSKNIAEYWRRWHITLGEWMKSYIFYPISVSGPMLKLSKAARAKLGNFGKRLPVYAASIATWAVTGIWHGLTPNFLLWGMMNCAVIVISEELQPVYDRFHGRFHLKQKKWYGGFEMLRMFLLMNFIRIVDLFPNVGDYFSRLGSLITAPNFQMFTDGTLMKLGLTGLDYGILGFGIAVMFTVSMIQEKKGSLRELLWEKPLLRYALVIALLVVTLLMGSYGIGYNASNFIYNQF